MTSTDVLPGRESLEEPTRSAARLSQRIVRALGTNWAFAIILAFAVAQSLAIAFTAGYGLVYDESYHWGLIKLFASQGTPFVSDPQNHPGFGDLTHFGSFLYQYLMAGPYALAEALGLDETNRLMVVRCITTLIGASSLIWFRKTLRLCGISAATTNASLLIFISIPLVPLLFATVNYDNLVLLLGAAFLWCGVRAFVADRINIRILIAMVGLGSLASLSTFLFLPLFAAGVVAVLARQLITLRHTAWRDRFDLLSARDVRSPIFWVTVVSAIVGAYYFVALYIVNLVQFHTPIPDCGRLNSVAYCSTYAVWDRNHQLLTNGAPKPHFLLSLPGYTLKDWFPGQFLTLALEGTTGHRDHATNAIPVLEILAVIAALALVLTINILWKTLAVRFISISGIAFVAVLFAKNYSDFVALGLPLGVQSRYLMILAPFVIAFSIAGLALIVDRLHPAAVRWKLWLLIATLAVLSQVGGAVGFFAVATPTWFSPDSWLGSFGPLISGLAHRINAIW
ncbi:MAG TPA: hypothetical protein VGI56_08690 [Galbitalea sp.]